MIEIFVGLFFLIFSIIGTKTSYFGDGGVYVNGVLVSQEYFNSLYSK